MSSSAFELERSLLQKAVRRGNVELVEKVFNYLYNLGDFDWLRKRLAVMVYEECWTYADQLLYPKQPYKLLEEYKILTKTIKNKNAAGLVELAIEFNEGATSALIDSKKDQRAIKTVANAITRPDEFWGWIKSDPDYQKNAKRIDAAERDINKALFPNDKTMMLAAAYLALRYPIPETQEKESENDPNFPYWIAVDKHTSIGRDIYIEACNSIDLQAMRGMHLGFYLEGGVCNKVENSPFWDHMVNWYLNHIHFTMDEAKEKWEELKPILIVLTKDSVNEMLDRINNLRIESDQLELFE